MKSKLKFMDYFYIGLFISLLWSYVIYFICNNDNMVKLFDNIIYDLFFTELSLAFIVVSFVTFLSNKSKKIYWIDIIEYKLTKPKFLGAIDTTAYIIANLVIAISSLFFNYTILSIDYSFMPNFIISYIEYFSNYSIYIFSTFLLNLIYICFITGRLASAYLSNDDFKCELGKKYKEAKDKNSNEFSNVKNKLISATFEAIKEGNYETIVDNLNLLSIEEGFTSSNTFKELMFNLLLDNSWTVNLVFNQIFDLVDNADVFYEIYNYAITKKVDDNICIKILEYSLNKTNDFSKIRYVFYNSYKLRNYNLLMNVFKVTSSYLLGQTNFDRYKFIIHSDLNRLICSLIMDLENKIINLFDKNDIYNSIITLIDFDVSDLSVAKEYEDLILNISKLK